MECSVGVGASLVGFDFGPWLMTGGGWHPRGVVNRRLRCSRNH